MKKRERLNVYLEIEKRYYLLFRIINIGTEDKVDLKISGFGDYLLFTENSSIEEKGFLNENDIDSFIHYNKMEMSYYNDGSFLWKLLDQKDKRRIHHNPYGQGKRWTPINEVVDFQPIMNIVIRRMAIYHPRGLEVETSKIKNYVCHENEELFKMNGSYFIIVYARNNQMPVCKFTNKDMYSDVLCKLNSELDICIMLQRHSYPAPLPYYSSRFNCYITPYPINSISFCNKKDAKDDMILNLQNNIFNKTFYRFLQIMNGDTFEKFTEEKLQVIDQIDILYSHINNTSFLIKPLFVKFVLSALGDKINKYNLLSITEKQIILSFLFTELQNGLEKELKEMGLFQLKK